MRNRMIMAVLLAALCLSLFSPRAAALEPLDPDAQASLTLHYRKDGTPFPGLQIELFRIAEAFPDGSFQLIAPYDGYPVEIHGITEQAQWKHIASTLEGYITADSLQPDRLLLTDGEGTAAFEQLQTGLYFVRKVTGENENGIYRFDSFLVYLPTPREGGGYDYQVEALPKCAVFISKTHYTVTKLWKDGGSGERPDTVKVEIYRSGVLQETVVLSADNSWSYTWAVSEEDTGSWTVAERDVPEDYKVTLQENGGHFTLVNGSGNEIDPPHTGDTFALLPWTLGLCLSGLLLLILGLYGRRYVK